jgi:hypothetical protein
MLNDDVFTYASDHLSHGGVHGYRLAYVCKGYQLKSRRLPFSTSSTQLTRPVKIEASVGYGLFTRARADISGRKLAVQRLL